MSKRRPSPALKPGYTRCVEAFMIYFTLKEVLSVQKTMSLFR